MNIYVLFLGTSDQVSRSLSSDQKDGLSALPNNNLRKQIKKSIEDENATFRAKSELLYRQCDLMTNMDYFVLVEGVKPHDLGGLFTSASPWLEKTFIPRLFGAQSLSDQGCFIFRKLINDKGKLEFNLENELPLLEDLSRVNLYLTGFSRGAVMTFLLAKLLHKTSVLQAIKPRELDFSIHIAAVEPVAGNLVDYKTIPSMHKNAYDLSECNKIVRCVVALAAYRAKDKTLCFNQMCPLPVGRKFAPQINPFIFNKYSHVQVTNIADYLDKLSLRERENKVFIKEFTANHYQVDFVTSCMVFILAAHYAKFPFKINDAVGHKLNRNDPAAYFDSQTIKRLGVSDLQITGKFNDERKIYGLPRFSWRQYVIKSEPAANYAGLISNLDRVMMVENDGEFLAGNVNNDVTIKVFASTLKNNIVLGACDRYLNNKRDKKSDGYKRIVMFRGILSADNRTDADSILAGLDSLFLGLVKYRKVGSESFSGDPVNDKADSFGFILANNLYQFVTMPTPVAGESSEDTEMIYNENISLLLHEKYGGYRYRFIRLLDEFRENMVKGKFGSASASKIKLGIKIIKSVYN
ncbi:hypothetical protein F6R98_00445 [Candidatus Methylospira mobilis]|uniref:Uncharacterized protein n=1 Tax=Candidatus Methylospira mobilis TaxID=1808979 RepID=A0A5Q0BBX1_9GAMM|nr:hypothetical protein [Candidatus Methylospira mobilis]QFY41270.1 hypothetical protein F6R98_00445 [Candidatus Methylospira mobilis]WNV05508.1 hypothetical protein RP726_03600 [Candidatus Methylospira mobilis]